MPKKVKKAEKKEKKAEKKEKKAENKAEKKVKKEEKKVKKEEKKEVNKDITTAINDNIWTLMRSISANKLSMFEKKVRKELRNIVINTNLWYLRLFNMPDNVIGFVVKSIHFHTPGFFFVLYCLLPRKLAVLAIIPLFCCLMAFFYFDGCFLTILEYKLTSQDINIIDPLIYLMRDEVNPTNRYIYTIGLTIVYFIIVSLILWLRFKFNL